MAVLNKEEYMSRLKERIGEDTSDEAVRFVEDFTDTFNDFETRSTGNSDEEWQRRYDELDQSWRKKYRDRFFNSETTPSEVKEEQTENVKEDTEIKSFEELFTEREG